MASSVVPLLLRLVAIVAAIQAATATPDGTVQRTSSIFTNFLDDSEVLPTYNRFAVMEHRILSNHWLRGQSRGSCSDACPWCTYWGSRYCQPGWVFKGKPVSTYWCARTCNSCSTGFKGPLQGRTFQRARQKQQGSDNASPTPRGYSTTAGGTTGDYATDLLALVNMARGQNGAGPLCLNSKLSAAGQGHCQDMSARNYFTHDSQDGTKFNERIQAAGYQARGWTGENIAKGYTDTTDVFNAWKNSPGHWRNIIKPEFQHMGISKVDVFWCQEFGQSDLESCN